MGIGSRGGVRAARLPAFLIFLLTCTIVLLTLTGCGGGEVEQPAAAPADPPATPIMIATPIPTPPPRVITEPPAAPTEPEMAPTATRLVVAPGSGPLPRRVNTPTPEPTEEPTPEPTPMPTAEPTAAPTLVTRPTPRPTPTSTPVPPTSTPLPTVAPTATTAPAPSGGSAPVVPAGSPIIGILAGLGNNLKWVTHFDNDTKSWSLYVRSGTVTINELPSFPPKPASLSGYAPLTQISSGKSYTLFVSEDVTMNLGGKERKLTSGQNLIAW